MCFIKEYARGCIMFGKFMSLWVWGFEWFSTERLIRRVSYCGLILCSWVCDNNILLGKYFDMGDGTVGITIWIHKTEWRKKGTFCSSSRNT